MENITKVEPGKSLPLNLTPDAISQYPEAERLARSLEEDRAALDSVRSDLILKNNLNPEEAGNAIHAYMKFMVMAQATHRQIAPSELADQAWHLHILRTMEYGPFCRRHFGRFIHHVPSEPNSHPPDTFFREQHQLGNLFYGKYSIYASHHGHCVNHHACDTWGCSPAHACVPGPQCTIN